MAANPKKGHYGHLKNPRKRMFQLRALAGYTLEEAGLHLGVGKERVRHLCFLYGIKRRPHRRTPDVVWVHGGNWCLRRVKLKNCRLVPGHCYVVPDAGREIRVWTITKIGKARLPSPFFFPALADAKRAIGLFDQSKSFHKLYRETNPV
jgi:hypothetical protein